MNNAAHWDRLHKDVRFRPLYPNENVVRFLARNPASTPAPRALDIGTGGGRHCKLLAEFGYRVFGIDLSLTGLQQAQQWLRECGHSPTMAQASMTQLPFKDSCMDVALSFGVYYYGLQPDMQLSIRELHRILRPGGKALVVLRTTADYRYGRGEQLEQQTFRLTIDDTNELGSTQHFLSESDVPAYFSAFRSIVFERADFTFNERAGTNSDWLIQLEK